MMIAGYKISNWTNMHNRWDVNINSYLMQQFSMMTCLRLKAIMVIKSIPQIMVQTVCVGLGEMDDMLLRKIEELTLYVIELKKENEEMKVIVEALMNEI